MSVRTYLLTDLLENIINCLLWILNFIFVIGYFIRRGINLNKKRPVTDRPSLIAGNLRRCRAGALESNPVFQRGQPLR